MAYAIKWDEDTKRFYETGTSHGVLYVKDSTATTTNGYKPGVAWNGLTAFTESPSGAEETELYANDKKYGSLRSAEKFGGTIEAYTYPDEFEECDGSVNAGVTGVSIGQQTRRAFGFTYQTIVGNDESSNAGVKLHIVYNCTVSPSEKSYASVNDSPEAITFSWELSANPVTFTYPTTGDDATEYSTYTIMIDTTKLDESGLTNFNTLLDNLYGKAASTSGGTATSAVLLAPEDVLSIMATGSKAA